MCKSCKGGSRAITTGNNVDIPVVGIERFAKESMAKMDRMYGDPGYAICICGGQGDCMGCQELELLSILKHWN